MDHRTPQAPGPSPASVRASRLRVGGIVQGVGFRPYVYGLATKLGLAGNVFNDSAGVVIEIQGDAELIEEFCRTLRADPPPLARIESVDVEDLAPSAGLKEFRISSSRSESGQSSPISPDIATCAECVAEIFDPASRRYLYAFTNCTNCGPRYTITKNVPYDRSTTTMAAFEMCRECRAEYEDPSDRRFHAQPIACPACGPKLSLLAAGAGPLVGDPLDAAVTALERGLIVAIKGMGGYHLACDATEENAVERLRLRKAREEKPLAVMVKDIAALEKIAVIDGDAEELLLGPGAPIVLLQKRSGTQLADAVAPGNRYIGVMLPYTPLHHLLLTRSDVPLVMTSGNLSDEPIAFEDADAFDRLDDIADLFLSHDRPIHIRCDDSVTRSHEGVRFPLRRSRGWAPAPLPVDTEFVKPVLATGGELKSTVCVGVGRRAILSHHIGDLENWETMESFIASVEHLTKVHGVVPKILAHDLHPDYLSTKWALDRIGYEERVAVQHHHAHVASCLGDNRRDGPVIGLALDGSGFGDDGAIWGGEVLVADFITAERKQHLAYVPLPGGVAAIKEPWRMGAVYLERAFGAEARDLDISFVRGTAERWDPILRMAERGINSPQTSSAGRMFDAVAAICGLRNRVSYEGQAAAELEQVAEPSIERTYALPPASNGIDGPGLVRALAEDLSEGRDVPSVAAAFHNTLAVALAVACEQVREQSGLKAVALTGGTFQNVLLLRRTERELNKRGFSVLRHRRVPPNDGGLSFGQALIASERNRRGYTPPGS